MPYCVDLIGEWDLYWYNAHAEKNTCILADFISQGHLAGGLVTEVGFFGANGTSRTPDTF